MGRHSTLWMAQGFVVGCLLASSAVQAQVVPDGTLGNERSRVNLVAPGNEQVEGGALRGVNLFHSFREFNVREGGSAYFANPAAVQNIFSRVTGGNVSNINGTLGVLGAANLFLLNPNGIIFGPNARLDVAGSFFASTASGLKFADGSEFSATNPQAAPLLMVDLTPGLQKGGTPPIGNINNAGSLAVPQGKTLTLYGNTVTSTGTLIAPGGIVQMLGDRVGLLNNAQVDVSALGGGGTVLIGGDFQGNGTVPNASHTFIAPSATIRADAINSGNGGRVIIWADEATRFYGRISAKGGSQAGNGGFVEVSGKQNLAFQGIADVSASVGQPGTVLLDPRNIIVSNNPNPGANDNELNNDDNDKEIRPGDGGGLDFQISAARLSSITGTVLLEATQNITFNAPVTFVAQTGLTANAGGEIKVEKDSNITTKGGSVTFTATGNITVTESDIDVSTDIGYGRITLRSNGGSVFVNGANLKTNSTVGNTAGDVLINAFEAINITNTATRASSVESKGSLGYIFIGRSPFASDSDTLNPKSVKIQKSSLIATNDGMGADRGGRINIDAGKIDLINASLKVASSNDADGGRVDLKASASGVSLTESSLIDATINGTNGTNGTGNQINGIEPQGRGVTITALNGQVTLDTNSQITTTATGLVGNTVAGSPITITSPFVSLKNRAALTATASVSAEGGNITINAQTGTVTLDSSSLINTAVQTDGQKSGGNIIINNAQIFELKGGSRIQTRTLGTGNAGNVELNFSNTATIDGINRYQTAYSGILTSSDNENSGQAGKITINKPSNPIGTLTLSNGAFLSAKTASNKPGNNGNNIEINVNNLNILSGGQILTSTASFADAGKIIVNVTGNVTLSGKREELSELPTPSDFSNVPLISGLSFNKGIDPNIDDATSIPHTFVQRGTTTDDRFDYYSFTVTKDGSRGIFDIDNAASVPASSLDTKIFLFDKKTGELLGWDDDFRPTDLGSAPYSLDSKIFYNFNSAGDYVLAVGKYSSTQTNSIANNSLINLSKLQPNDTYRLQVSIQNDQNQVTSFSSIDSNPNQGLNSGMFSGVQPSEKVSGNIIGRGQGGDISVNSQTGTIYLSDAAVISAATAGIGGGGNVKLQAGNSITLTNGARVEARTTALGDANDRGGDAGNIVVNAPDIRISGSTQLNGQPLFSGILSSSDTARSGKPGSITVNRDTPGQTFRVENGGFLSTFNRGEQEGQNITINVTNLSLINGGQVITAAEGIGSAGSITINSPNVEISGKSSVFSPPDNTQLAGFSITADPRVDYATIIPHQTISGTLPTNGFLYEVNVSSAGTRAIFDIDNSAYPANLDNLDVEFFLFKYDRAQNRSILLRRRDDARPEGDGGGSTSGLDPYFDYVFDSPGTYYLGVASFNFSSNSLLRVGSSISGLPTIGSLPKPFTLQVSIDQRNNFNPNQSANSGLFAQSIAKSGNAGKITVNGGGSGRLSLTNEAQIRASTVSGNSGDINLLSLRTLDITDSGIAALTEGGRAGNIMIDMRDRLQATNGRISTSAENGSGGQIDITARDIWLSGDSDIRTLVNSGVNKGGNITLNAFSIIALGDSDILAYAKDGEGGDIDFGKTPILLTFRYFPVPDGIDRATLDSLDNNGRVDINASGALGNGNINFPDLDPSRGLSPLPTGTRDPSNLIDQTCSPNNSQANNSQTNNNQASNSQTNNSQTNKFINEGRGGLPPSPDSSLNTDTTLAQLATILPSSTNRSSQATLPPPETKPDSPIVEAQGWIKLPNGRVKFVAQAATVTPHGNWQPSSSCLNSQGQ